MKLMGGNGLKITLYGDPRTKKNSARILQGRCWSAPVLANGLLYARNAQGEAVCLDLRP